MALCETPGPATSRWAVRLIDDHVGRLAGGRAATAKEVATHDDAGGSRQQAALSDKPRPVAATKNATDGSEADRDLAVVVAVWRDLPDSVRVAVMRIIEAG